MQVKRVDGYYKHGCAFAGKIAVVSYQEDMEKDPRYGAFGSMVVFDYSEKAQQLAEERYPNCKVLLAVPDVVVRISE